MYMLYVTVTSVAVAKLNRALSTPFDKLLQALPFKGSESDCSPTALLNLFWAELFIALLKLLYHCYTL